jgi:hypothetical protein
MMTLIRNGGFPMFFIMAFGLIALSAAGWYAVRPNARSLGVIVWMGAATLFASLMGTVADLGAVAFAVSAMIEKGNKDWVAIVFEGFAESMSPPIMGFALLSMVALVTAVGKARA